ncbi:hypothetical protein DYB37_004041 [Aphanomyces astaci]|uniref:No mechanoreceptor potential B n=2 Tax=Aphanomyces astaci TaxID=112090 RepID=A0A3R7AWG9_APHAT|nr:hypothetical protein DYB35_005587 [Aphanomyces astaci]RHZ32792.1 hypothetical protein DYB37_004041 [Aphanomyces astaci]
MTSYGYNSGNRSKQPQHMMDDDEDEDLYEGFNYSIDLAPPQTASMQQTSSYFKTGQSGQNGGNNPPGTAFRAPPSQMGRQVPTARLQTGQQGSGEVARPMTSVTGAGFSVRLLAYSNPKTAAGQRMFDPLGEARKTPAPPLAEKAENSPKETAKELEKLVNALIEQSSEAAVKHESEEALRLAKEAGKKERAFTKHCETHGLTDMTNIDLTYTPIVKNKQYPQGGRLRVNMQQYPTAIRMYRMALDQIPNTSKEIRFNIKKNIGSAQIKLGHYQDAATTFEDIMEGNPDFQSGFNLIICYYAIGEHEKMRRGLKAEIRERQKKASEFILTAAKLCAPALDKKDWLAGYNWVIDAMKALHFLKSKDFDKAIEVLKAFEKKDPALKAMAATNLSFLYFVEGDYAQADKFASLAVRHQRYNAKALVNKGNCLYVKNECERAKELYLEAIGVEADCIEAIFNLGLVNIKIGVLNEALQAFEKLHSIVPTNTEVLYQIANLHDMMGNYRQAAKWFNILLSCFGSAKNIADPGVLARMGQIFNKDDDETQAFHFHLESYRHFPVNLDVISWLGVWYVKSELYEKAIQFFERAAQIQPTEVKWRLMVTSCHRRMGAYQKALVLYEQIHVDYPDNLECLRYLVAICKDLGQKYEHHQQALAKLERENAAKINSQTNTTQQQATPQQQQSMNRPASGVYDHGGRTQQREATREENNKSSSFHVEADESDYAVPKPMSSNAG